jgi:D-sedoheptulose 7-phosphate isomerase
MIRPQAKPFASRREKLYQRRIPMSDVSEILQSAIEAATTTLKTIVDLERPLGRAADVITECLRGGNKLLVCGNGGSAADAADFCTELACRFVEDRRPYPAMNLSQGGSLLTATGNDYGFDEIFARQVRAFGQAGDVLIVISTSGKSANIRCALEQGRKMKLRTIALLGRDGGASIGIADVDLVVKGDATARIQEAHKFLLHVICEICEARLPR